MVVVSDRKVYDGSVFKADLVSTTDYYAFGMVMSDRSYNTEGYRFGFNGKENDNEVKGTGNQQDYGMRIYDARLGRFLSVDPLMRKYPEISPYAFSINSPLMFKDADGRDAIVSIKRDEKGGGTITISTTVYVIGKVTEENVEGMNNKSLEIYGKGGKYTDKDGNNWTIKIDVSYKQAEGFENSFEFFTNKEATKDFKYGGDNVMIISDYDHLQKKSNDRSHQNRGAFEKGKGQKLGAISYIQTIHAAKPWVEIHETGHLLGLEDRYEDVGNASRPFIGWEDDLMSTYGSGQINQTHFDNWGETILNLSQSTGKDNFNLNYSVDLDLETGALKGEAKKEDKKETKKEKE